MSRWIRNLFYGAVSISLAAVACALSIEEKSPFIWPDFSEPAQGRAPVNRPTSSQNGITYEFHAIYELSGSTRILLKDSKSNQFSWFHLGEEIDGVHVKDYNRQDDSVLVSHQSEEIWITLKSLPTLTGRPANAVATSRSDVSRPTTSASSRRAVTSSRTVRSSTSARTQRTPPRIRRARSSRLQPSPPSTNANPGTIQPSFVPQDPGAAPSSRPPRSLPPAAPVAPAAPAGVPRGG